jgi:hypothetical protein
VADDSPADERREDEGPAGVLVPEDGEKLLAIDEQGNGEEQGDRDDESRHRGVHPIQRDVLTVRVEARGHRREELVVRDERNSDQRGEKQRDGVEATGVGPEEESDEEHVDAIAKQAAELLERVRYGVVVELEDFGRDDRGAGRSGVSVTASHSAIASGRLHRRAIVHWLLPVPSTRAVERWRARMIYHRYRPHDVSNGTMSDVRISTEYTYNGIDTAFLENETLRLQILTGKGGDILEFRDKRADVDVLWDTAHNWVPPGDRYVPGTDPGTWKDHNPGGWQLNLPVAGSSMDIDGSSYGLHGESALLPWDATILEDSASAVTLGLSTELVRYPFYVEREITLPAGESSVHIEESVTNRGTVPLEYVWQQHVVCDGPLLSPDARIDVPARTGIVDDGQYENGRLEPDTRFEWPDAPLQNGGTVDVTEIPHRDERIHDLVFATDLTDGWYALTNPEMDLGFALEFPVDPFECLWYWQAFGGAEKSPHFGRTYNAGLEPTTAYPGHSLPERQRENDTIDVLDPGETIEATYRARTYRGYGSVSDVTDGEVRGTRS